MDIATRSDFKRALELAVAGEDVTCPTTPRPPHTMPHSPPRPPAQPPARCRAKELVNPRRVEDGHGGHATDCRVRQNVAGLIKVTVTRPCFAR